MRALAVFRNLDLVPLQLEQHHSSQVKEEKKERRSHEHDVAVFFCEVIQAGEKDDHQTIKSQLLEIAASSAT